MSNGTARYYANRPQGARGNGFSTVESILKKALKRNGIENDITRYKFVTQWGEIVGEELAKRTKPAMLRNGVLIVNVSNSAWAQELSLRKEVIITRLKRISDDASAVTDVQFMVGEV